MSDTADEVIQYVNVPSMPGQTGFRLRRGAAWSKTYWMTDALLAGLPDPVAYVMPILEKSLSPRTVAE